MAFLDSGDSIYQTDILGQLGPLARMLGLGGASPSPAPAIPQIGAIAPPSSAIAPEATPLSASGGDPPAQGPAPLPTELVRSGGGPPAPSALPSVAVSMTGDRPAGAAPDPQINPERVTRGTGDPMAGPADAPPLGADPSGMLAKLGIDPSAFAPVPNMSDFTTGLQNKNGMDFLFKDTGSANDFVKQSAESQQSFDYNNAVASAFGPINDKRLHASGNLLGSFAKGLPLIAAVLSLNPAIGAALAGALGLGGGALGLSAGALGTGLIDAGAGAAAGGSRGGLTGALEGALGGGLGALGGSALGNLLSGLGGVPSGFAGVGATSGAGAGAGLVPAFSAVGSGVGAGAGAGLGFPAAGSTAGAGAGAGLTPITTPEPTGTDPNTLSPVDVIGHPPAPTLGVNPLSVLGNVPGLTDTPKALDDDASKITHPDDKSLGKTAGDFLKKIFGQFGPGGVTPTIPAPPDIFGGPSIPPPPAGPGATPTGNPGGNPDPFTPPPSNPGSGPGGPGGPVLPAFGSTPAAKPATQGSAFGSGGGGAGPAGLGAINVKGSAAPDIYPWSTVV